MKKIFISLFFVFSLFISKPVFAGNDLTLTCNNSGCSELSGRSLFNETNIYPGFTASQKISIQNNRNSTCHLTFKANSNSQESNLLSQQISLTISSANSATDYNSTTYILSNLFGSSKSLGHIHKGDTNKYLWVVTFDSNADNTYRNQTTNFNIDFDFECDGEETTITPTPTSTSNSGSVQGAATSTECTNSVPAAPIGLHATTYDSGSITLHWTEPASAHDGYLIAFGTSPGVYQYGVPRVSDDDHYTVQGLTPGAQYCFYVRSLNGCMPGDRTPEYCVNPGSNTPAAVPTTYQQQVLGNTTDNVQTESPNNNVLGSQDSNCNKHWLPILFLIAFLINLIYAKFSTKNKLIPLINSLAAFLVDRHLLQSHCCFGPDWFCNYFWIGNILSWLIPMFVFKRKRK